MKRQLLMHAIFVLLTYRIHLRSWWSRRTTNDDYGEGRIYMIHKGRGHPVAPYFL